MAERVRLIEAQPDDGRGADPVRPALALLRDTEQVLAQLEDVLLTPEALAMGRAEWPELAHRGMHALATSAAGPLRTALAAAGVAPGSAADDLTALLDSADAGQLWSVAGHLPKSSEAAQATGRAARNSCGRRWRPGHTGWRNWRWWRRGRTGSSPGRSRCGYGCRGPRTPVRRTRR
ncbi:hypothetical protein ACFQ2B_02640 [Streptomyces stramineus]